MDEITIRTATIPDFELVYTFINLLEEQTFDEEHQRKIYSGNLNNPNIIYLMAEIKNKVIGFLSCHVQELLHHGGKVGQIEEMFVMKEYRNRAVGAKLVDAIKSMAKEEGILGLEVTSNKKRTMAHRFYESQNFRNTHKKFVYKM